MIDRTLLATLTDGFRDMRSRIDELASRERAETAGAVPKILLADLPTPGKPGRLFFITNASKPNEAPFNSLPIALHDDLVAWYILNEESGTRIDATGRGNNLADNNTVTRTTGHLANTYAALFVRANNEFLSSADAPDFRLNGIDWTQNYWINLTTKAAPAYDTISKWGATGPTQDYIAGYTGTGADRFYVGSSANEVRADTFGSPTAGVWHMVTHTFVQSTKILSIRVNAGVADTTSVPAGFPTSAAPFNLGAENNGSSGALNGAMQDVGIWKRALSDAEITTVYNLTLAATGVLVYDDGLTFRRVSDDVIVS